MRLDFPFNLHQEMMRFEAPDPIQALDVDAAIAYREYLEMGYSLEEALYQAVEKYKRLVKLGGEMIEFCREGWDKNSPTTINSSNFNEYLKSRVPVIHRTRCRQERVQLVLEAWLKDMTGLSLEEYQQNRRANSAKRLAALEQEIDQALAEMNNEH
jgi:hypothetical protein